MQELIFPKIKKLREKLTKFLKNKKIIDIFIIGSSVKDKLSPNDLDMIVLFRDKDHIEIENILYEIKQSSKIENLHIEPLIVDDMLSSKIFPSIIHEGVSIKNGKAVQDLIGYKAYTLFTFSLERLSNINKVRFAQAVYGRNNNGIIKSQGGISLGKGSFISPVEKTELFKDALTKHKATFKMRRSFIKD